MKEILFIHDQLENPWVRQHFLETAGYRVHATKSGIAGLERIAAQQPSLVLMDVLVEGRNGFDVCREIRKRHKAEDLPVILCSEIYRSRLFRDEAAAAGAQRYLLKPMRLDDLVREVAALIGEGAKGKNAA